MAISMHKFKYAHKLIVEQIRKTNDNSIKMEVLRTLVSRAIDVEKNTKLKLLELSKYLADPSLYSSGPEI